MDTRIKTQQIVSIFEEAADTDIDWSARGTHLASYIAAAHVGVDLCYDFSPATDDSDLARSFWTTYDAIYRTILSLDGYGSWPRIVRTLAIGEDFESVRLDIASFAMEVSLSS